MERGQEITYKALVTLLFNADRAQLPGVKAECLRNAYLLLQGDDVPQEYKDWYQKLQRTMPTHLMVPALKNMT